MNLQYSHRAFLSITFLFFTAFCSAATYYIDPNGNDVTGNGSISNPWKSLRKATQAVTAPGNIIHVNPGTYIETQQSFLAIGVSLEGAGTSSIIKSNLTGQFSTLLALDASNNTNGAQSISYLVFDGQYVDEANFKTWIGIFVTGRSNVSIHHCHILNFKHRGVVFDGNDAFGPVLDPGNYATGNKFYYNTVLNSAENNGIYGSGLLNIGSQMGMEIYGNTMIQDQRPDFKNGWPIKPWDNGWIKGVKIYNNTLVKAPYKGTFPGQNGDWDFCVEIFNVEGGVEIYNNNIQGSIDINYCRKGTYSFSAWIHHNNIGRPVFNPLYESAILLEYRTEYALIEYNVMNNVSRGIQFNTRTVNDDGGYPNPGGGTPPGGFSYLLNNTIRNNLFSNIYLGSGAGGAGGIIIASESGNDPQINGLNIYNNTIISKPGNAPATGLDFSSQENGNSQNVNIRNNIVNGFGYTWLNGSSPQTAMTGVVVTHNDAFGNGNNNPVWPGGNPANYTYNNNLSVNPQFMSSTDFRLQLISPVIDKGVDLGITYTGNAPDMGYAEYGLGGPLPITLVDFTGKKINDKNFLQWTTTSETNSDHFNIERSGNGINFEIIGSVNAVGYSTAETKYSFTDMNPLKGVSYYRLVMTDKDGRSVYSRIISINNQLNETTVITYCRLSAATKTATIIINSTQSIHADLSVTDAAGRTLLVTQGQLQTGMNSFVKQIPSLQTGVYYIRLLTKDGVVVKNVLCTDQ